LHIYDAYRADLQTQEEFTLEEQKMESNVRIISQTRKHQFILVIHWNL